jgi:hypothetical protein
MDRVFRTPCCKTKHPAMAPSTGERCPRTSPPLPPTSAGADFRPTCLAAAHSQTCDRNHSPRPPATLAREMVHHTPQHHHGAMKLLLYWRQETPAQTTPAPPPRRHRTQQCRQEKEGSAAHLAFLPQACT